MASRPIYPAASSSTSLAREQRPGPLDFPNPSPRTTSEESSGNIYANYQDPEVHSAYSSNYISPSLQNAKAPSSLSLVPSDDGTERHLNTGTNWPAPRKRQSRWREILFPNSIPCRLYLMVVVVETILDLAVESILLSRVQHAVNATSSTSEEDSPTLARNPIPVYLLEFGMAHVFQYMLALDAVYYKNVLQFLFLAIFNALLFVYAVLQIFEVRALLNFDSKSPGFASSGVVAVIVPVVVMTAEIAYIALGYKIYSEFGWQVFKLLGADRQIKRIYMQYQILQCLMRFDIFFWLGFSVQLIALVLEKGDFEFYVTIVALPLSMLLVFEGHLAARHESRWMMTIFGFGCIAAMVYFVYKLCRIWSQRTTDTFKDVYKTLTVFASISVLLLILTAIWATIVYRNFDNGLKHHLNKRKKGASDEVELEPKGGGYIARHPNRISIE